MPKFHSPQHTEDFVPHQQVRVMDTDGLPWETIPVRTHSAEDAINEAIRQIEAKGQLEVIDIMDPLTIIAKEA